MELEITTEYFLTLGGLALATALLVELLKYWLVRNADKWWYKPSVTTTAYVLAFGASLLAWYANRLTIDGPVAAFLFLQGIVIGALASGGYEWVKNIGIFVSGARGQS